MYDMTSVSRALPAADWAVQLNFDDVLDFTERVRPWQLDFTQVRRGQFRSSGLILSLGTLTLGCALINQAMVRRVRVPADQFSIFTIGRDSETSFVGAQMLRFSDCLCVRGPAEFEAVTRGPVTDLALSFDAAAWLGSGEWYEPLPADPGGLSLENFGVEWTEQLYRRVESVLEAAASPARTLDDPRVRASLAEQILTHLRSARPVEKRESTQHRARARRRAAVQRARQFIDSRLSEPIRLEQVCRYACAQSRTLEYGFREMFDTPMVGYIKALRMGRVRKLLRCPSQSHRTVSELALDTGFWHLSQFASDYKKFFGESPSQTHRRAGGATGPRLMTY